MAAGTCWICDQQTDSERHCRDVLVHSRDSVSSFVSKLGLMETTVECVDYLELDVVCEACVSVVVKLDELTYQTNECVEFDSFSADES